jgi:hypothetical protein
MIKVKVKVCLVDHEPVLHVCSRAIVYTLLNFLCHKHSFTLGYCMRWNIM